MITTAHALARAAAQLEEENISLRHDWSALFLDLRGPAPEAAYVNLMAASVQRDSPAELMRQASDILTRFAEYMSSSTVARVSGAGDVLDWLCAREIDALCTPTTPPTNRLEDFGDLPISVIHDINAAHASPEVQSLLAANPDVYLLEAPDGRFVAVIGDVHTQPASVTTYVPGVRSSDPATWQGGIDNARALSRVTGGPAVAWLGYSAPSTVTRALHRKPARDAARELVRFQKGIDKRWPQAQKIVVGYSYGSVVASHAGPELIADDVVLVGSPGARPNFRGRVWAATNANDPITWVTGPTGGAHGVEPDTFARPLPGAHRRPGGHLDYWKDPKFLNGIGALVRAAAAT